MVELRSTKRRAVVVILIAQEQAFALRLGEA
jgi:hypothetical protein